MNVARKSIAYNGFFSLLDKGYTAVSNLVLFSFIVHHLGMETYGIWVVLTTVGGYFVLGSLGINYSFEKYIAQYNAVHDEGAMRRFLVTALYTSIGVGLAMVLVSILCVQGVFYLFLKDVAVERYATVFYWVIVSSAFAVATLILLAVPRGLQRFDYSSGISMVARTVYIVIVVVWLGRGGLYSLVAAQIASAASAAFLSLLAGRRFRVPFSVNPRHFDWRVFKSMFSFGSKIQVGLVAVMIIQSFDKLLIAHFFPARLVGIYDLGSRLVMFLKDLPTFLFSSMLPRTSELHSQGNVAGLRRIYLAGTKYMAVICFGAVALLFPVAPEILNVLFRTPIDPLSIYVFQVLLISTMINSTTGVGTSIGMGIGKPGGIAVSNLVMAIVNILCSTAFFYAFGPKSVVWGTAASLFVSSVVYYGILNRSMGVRTAAFWSSSMAVPFFLNGIATLGLLELHDAARAMHPALFSGIFAGWAVIAVNCIVALTVSVAVYGASRFITMDELLEYLPFLKRWRKA